MEKKEKLETILAIEVKDFLIEMAVAWSTVVEKKTSASQALNTIIPINKACTYMYTQTCTTHIQTCTHTYTRVHTNMHDTHIQTCTHTYTRVYTHVHTYTQSVTWIRTRTNTYTHKSRHAFTVTCTHISAYTYTKHTLTSLERFVLERLVQRN